jgi:two-component system, sensor histidine kinase and response regulator
MDALRVLVVDDELWIRAAVARDLKTFTVSIPDMQERIGFLVDEAETGEEALEKIEAQQPHIMLLDLKLPGISGLEVLDQIKEKHTDLLTIMITAYASIETAVRATKSGAYDFVAKPFTPEELEHVLQKAARQIVVAERARELAREQRQVRFQFISVLAHELKAPLNAIEGYLNVIMDHSAGDDPRIYEEMLRRSMARTRGMRKMIVDLLDLTRIESGLKQRELAPVDLLDVAQTAIETAMPDAAQRNISVHLHCEAPIVMQADRNELDMVLNNLVSNAVKYNNEGGEVAVNLSRRDDAVLIAVSDTGIGMSEEDREQLFEPFVRIKNEKTIGILGSGLGLAILKKVALMYNGDVTVTSAPEMGSTFTVTLRDIASGFEGSGI